MNKPKCLIMAVTLIISGYMVAREMRAPLPFRNGFQRFEHYPYICENLEKCWEFDFWGGAFHRQAFDAFRKGTQKESLSALYFGADSFPLIDAFPGGAGNGGIIALDFAVLTPRFNYSENGAMFGFNINRQFCCGLWDVGARINIPFRAVSVTFENCCDFVETDLSDVYVVKDEVPIDENCVPGVIRNSFAARLDFLASLPLTVNNNTCTGAETAPEPLLNFRNPRNNDAVTINQNRVDQGGTDNTTLDSWGVHLVAVPVGGQPELPCTRRQKMACDGQPAPVEALENLPNNGALADGERARFGLPDENNYTQLANDRATQRRLWVVPTGLNQCNGGFELTRNARAIGRILSDVADRTLTTIPQFLRARGITFDTQHLTGAGDLDVDFYARRNWCDECYGDWYLEGITGIRFPTGKSVDDPGLLLAQPLGSNHHFEWKVGAQVGYQPNEWFALKADAQFYHVFGHTEQVAASFTGARIKNIGPRINADVSWNYFLGNLDFTFVVPCAHYCSGFDIGYQPYYKLKDKVKFGQVTALDFQGMRRTLDPNVIEANTKRVAHRIKTEMFHKTCTWEIYGGWLHTIAGKNIQRETDWYLGFGMFF